MWRIVMGAKTLYVSEQDEQVWEDAKSLGGGDGSMSKTVTEALRQYADAARSAAAEAEAEAHESAADAQLVARFRRELQAAGWQRAGQAFARACVDYGAARSRAARKAHETMGPEGRQAAARKAQETKGLDGRREAARKAQETLGPEGRKRAAQKAAETRQRNR
jgi:hypothetical protein